MIFNGVSVEKNSFLIGTVYSTKRQRVYAEFICRWVSGRKFISVLAFSLSFNKLSRSSDMQTDQFVRNAVFTIEWQHFTQDMWVFFTVVLCYTEMPVCLQENNLVALIIKKSSHTPYWDRVAVRCLNIQIIVIKTHRATKIIWITT